MSGKWGKSVHASLEGPVLEFATQLVDNPDQLETYDTAKWNLLGHADKILRFQGQHPWLKRFDEAGVERTYSVPVFSGFSPSAQSVMSVRKDPWTHQNDPASWIVAEQNLVTGAYVEPQILSASVDKGNQLWLQLAPANHPNWPPGRHPGLHAPRYGQLRVSSQLDAAYHVDNVEYREGLYGKKGAYQDLEVLEAMIVAVQLRRHYENEQLDQKAHDQRVLFTLGSVASEAA